MIVAAGRGERLGAGRAKALVEVGGRPLLAWALDTVRTAGIDEIVVVAPPGELDAVRAVIGTVTSAESGTATGTPAVVPGGDTRQASVRAGLQALGPDVDAVLVHDAARCLTPTEVFEAVLDALASGHPAVVPGVPVVDTLRERSGGVVDREPLVAVQTPQGFARHVLDAAHAAASRAEPSATATDDAGLVEAAGVPVHLVAGHELAFKVTRPIDVVLAEGLVAQDRR